MTESKRDYAAESLKMHYEKRGKIAVVSTVPVRTREDLSLAYTPGVAQPCLEIQKDVEKSFDLTRRWNMCLVVTDGTAVLGLGDIGPEAGMPVMEGKCVLFKTFGDVDAFPLCIKSKDVDEIVKTIHLISGSFGGVNLEDISAPRCFEIERRLKEICDIPIFHDDQHGTAVVTLAGLANALRLVGKRPDQVRVVLNGAGAAAISITKLLLTYGIKDVTLCDRTGAVYKGREQGMNAVKAEIAEITNRECRRGTLKEVIVGADVFIGVSAPGTLTEEMVASMQPGSVIVDISIDQGGNCAITTPGETAVKHHVTIEGIKNIPGMLPTSSTWMFANNIYNLVKYLVKDGTIVLQRGDEIIAKTLTTIDGEIVHAGAREAMGI